MAREDGPALTAAERRYLANKVGVSRVFAAAMAARGRGAGGDESAADLLADPAVLDRLARRRAGAVGRALLVVARMRGVEAARLPERSGNARVYTCVWPPADCPRAADLTRAVTSRTDRAHDVRDGDGMLLPAARLNGQARPRRYPAANKAGHFNSRGHTYEEVCDELYERQVWLDREVGGVDGVSYARGGREAVGARTCAMPVGDGRAPELGNRRRSVSERSGVSGRSRGACGS